MGKGWFSVGDCVIHRRYPQWGMGRVVEVWNGELPGGKSYVKVAFSDGRTRIFDNSTDSSTYCVKTGLIKVRVGD